MSTREIDALGLRCPQPILKIATLLPDFVAGDVLVVRGDCPSFEQDIRVWCDRMGKTLLSVNTEGNTKVVQILF